MRKQRKLNVKRKLDRTRRVDDLQTNLRDKQEFERCVSKSSPEQLNEQIFGLKFFDRSHKTKTVHRQTNKLSDHEW